MLLVRLPVNGRLLVVRFWGSQKIPGFATAWGVGAVSVPNPVFKGQVNCIVVNFVLFSW